MLEGALLDPSSTAGRQRLRAIVGSVRAK